MVFVKEKCADLKDEIASKGRVHVLWHHFLWFQVFPDAIGTKKSVFFPDLQVRNLYLNSPITYLWQSDVKAKTLLDFVPIASRTIIKHLNSFLYNIELNPCNKLTVDFAINSYNIFQSINFNKYASHHRYKLSLKHFNWITPTMISMAQKEKIMHIFLSHPASNQIMGHTNNREDNYALAKS